MKRSNIYNAVWIGGKRDGEILKSFESEYEAIVFASDFFMKNMDKFDVDYGCVAVIDKDGNISEW